MKQPSRSTVVATGLLLGAAGSVMYGSLGPMIGGLYGVLALGWGIRAGLDAIGALLAGFGGTWTSLMLAQFSRGGTTGDNDAAWLAFGLVPFGIGLLVLVVAIARAARRPTA